MTPTEHDAADAITVARLYRDGADTTRFVDERILWHPSAAIGSHNAATELLPASQIGFLRLATGFRSDWHPAPRRQYVMVLEGTMAVEAGDGEVREFSAGSVLLVTDTEGRGHRTSVVGNTGVILVWVPVPAD